MALIELSRASDVFYSRPLFTQEANPLDLAGLYGRGVPKILAQFLDDSAEKPGAPLVSSNEALQGWSHSVIQQAGRLSQLEHLLELANDGVFDIGKSGSYQYELLATREIIDCEAFDLADQHWLRDLTSEIDAPLQNQLAQRLPMVLERMWELVFPSRGDFIGYDTDPEIDEHFDAAGIAWARTLDGQLELPGDESIGGHPFYAYRAAVGIMCGIALKHASFASELALLHQQLDYHNLMSTWSKRSKWIDVFAGVLEVDDDTADHLLDALTLDREYRDAFEAVPGAPMPPFIQVGRDDLLMSLRGCLDAPFWFVLRKLQYRFRGDWDRLVNLREEQFREDLNLLFRKDSIIKSPRLVRIRSAGRDITDIDAAAFEKEHGTLLLFQLKWQDPFGFSMRERRSKMKNLISVSNTWINAVEEWTQELTRQELLQRLGMVVNPVEHPIRRIELIILVRHHARFSGSDEPSPNAAWGTWPQICRIAVEHFQGGDLLALLADRLREEQWRTDSPRRFETGSLQIGDVEIVVRVEPHC
ncbi:MAG: hypothetical protein AABP62_19710 [Planctomycetota bacterium]